MTALPALAARVAAPRGRILVITDFDGTISEIDPDPMGARILPLARVALRRLGRIAQERPDRLALAILTGQAVPDVVSRARVGGVWYLGNHGIDAAWLPRRGSVSALAASTTDSAVASPAARLGREVADALGDPDWLFVEIKGGSVAFHYRRAPVPAEAGPQIGRIVDERLAAGDFALERFDGRLIVELRPIGAGGKGEAVGRLLAELAPASVLAMGDDRSDAEGFAILAERRVAGRLAALNVGIHDRSATPPELIAASDVMLAAPRDAARLLSALATELER
ncbi:MAG TPA: trehalose-phosphatase [Candidatus Limnocylindrales bacterium]|nr:trehalose-phosphatase [Candidatus Limnocylindrales bacterium]